MIRAQGRLPHYLPRQTSYDVRVLRGKAPSRPTTASRTQTLVRHVPAPHALLLWLAAAAVAAEMVMHGSATPAVPGAAEAAAFVGGVAREGREGAPHQRPQTPPSWPQPTRQPPTPRRRPRASPPPLAHCCPRMPPSGLLPPFQPP